MKITASKNERLTASIQSTTTGRDLDQKIADPGKSIEITVKPGEQVFIASQAIEDEAEEKKKAA